MLFLFVPLAMQAQTTIDVEVGTGTTTSYTGGFCTYYQYTWQENIYLAQDIQTYGGYINSIAWYSATTNTLNTTDLRIYMGTTTRTTHSSTSDWQPQSELTLVYSSTSAVIGGVVGWKTFTLNTPFYYNGVDNLVVVVAKKATSTSSSTTHRYTNTTNAVLYRNSSSDQSYANYPGTSTGTRSYYLANIKLNITEVLPTCPTPRDVVVSSLTSTDATMSWTPQGNTSVFDLYLTTNASVVPNDNTTPTVPSVTDTFYTFTSLTPSTNYRAFVRANCSSEYSPWKYLPFTTACSPITTLPYTENFDSYATGESGDYPTCWGKINTYSSNRPYVNTTHYGASGNSLYFYTGTSGTYNIAVTPPFDASINISGLQAVFMYRATNGTDRLIVGVMSNPTDASTFVPVDTVYPASTASTWIEKTVYFNNYTGTGQYIAFKNGYTSTSCYAYIDNVEIDNIPTCPKPLSLTSTAVSTNSVTLSWNDPSSASSWNIEYGLGTFTPGTGVGTMVTATSNPFTVTGLTASTNYTFYVQSDCGGGDLSYFSDAYTVGTACDLITTLPYMEDFDNYTGATSTSVSVNNLPLCWNNLNNGTNTSYTGYPIIYNSTSYAYSAPNVLRFYTGSSTYGDEMAILPPFDDVQNPINTLQVSFMAQALSTSYPFTLVVGVLTNPASMSSFTPVDTLTITSTVHNLFEIPFNNYTGTGNYIGILAPRTTTGMNYGYVDDVKLELIPDCTKPNHVTVGSITSSSVTVNWVPGDQESMWELAVVPQGQSISNVIPETVSAYPYVVNNLIDDTPYNVYIRAICPSGGYSNWTPALSFRTDPLCTSPRDVTVSQITGSSAMVFWDAALVGASDYTVEYTEQGMNNWTNMLASSTSALIPNLIPQTNYTVRVFSNCTLGTADTVSVNFTTRCMVGGLIEIGSGTTTSTYLPSYSGSTRSYSQQIFKKSELGAAGTIDTLAIQLSSINSSANRSISIYLVHTSADAIFSWVPTTGAQLVWSGTTHWQTGWNMIPLTTPFAYNGVDNLLMVIIDNTGTSVTSPYNTYRTHSAFSGSARYTTGSTYSIGSVPSAAGTSLSTRNNVKFYMDCDNTVTCVAPNVMPTDVTDESITVEWVPGYMESSWDLEYRAGNGSWISEGTVTASPYILTNLTPGTQYSVRLRSDCGGTYSDWAGFSVTTECSSVTLPFSENFDSAPGSGAGNMAPCWTRNTNYTTAYPYTYSTYSHSGSYSVYFYGTSAYYSYIASPRFDDQVQMNNLQIRFWAYKTSAAYQIEVGIMSDPDDFGTFESLGQFSPTNLSLWQKFEVNTNLYTGTGRYIAFRMPTNMTSYMYLDDVEIYEIPACDHVDNIHTVGTPATTSLNVGWTPRGTETQWNVVYGLKGTITDPSQETPTVVYTPSISLSGLTHSSFYDVFVKSDCGSDTSAWEKGTVHTACDLISTLPFLENFDDYIPGTTSSNVMPLCWSHLNTGTSYAGCPTVYNSSTYASSGTQCLYFYGSSTSTYADQYAILPQMDVNTLPINTLRLSFKARRYTTTDTYVNIIIVGVMSNPSSASTFVPVDTVTLTSTTVGTHHVDFTNYTGTGSYIAIMIPKPDGVTYTSASPNYIDDVMLDVAPACTYPTNLQVSNVTTTDATVSWNAGSTETEWEMVLVQGNAPMSSGTLYNVYTNTETLTGLTSGTQYTIYLRAVCPQGGHSEYVSTSFTTQCEDLQTLPFTCNFDNVPGSTSGTVANLPVCWTNHSGTYSSYVGYPIVYNSSSYANSGSNSLRFYTGTTTTYDYGNQYAVLPPIDVNYNPINTLQMTLDVRKNSTSYANFTLIVGVMTDPLSVNTFVPVDTIVQTETAYHTYTVYFSNYTGTGKNIAIYAPTHAMNGVTYNTGYVDNIVVEPIPACPPVMNFNVSNVAGSSALLTWEEGIAGMATDFIVEYSEYNQSNWITETGVTGTTHFLSGLNPQTHYEVRVKANCGVSESTWQTADFTTGCLAGGEIEVGTGTTTNYYLPVNNFYRYTYSQQIFLASELNGPTDIQSISFQYAYSSPSTKKTSVNIYLGHTTQSTFTGTSNYVPLDSLTLVYSGNLNCTQGWNTFPFNNVFHYNGTSNLVVAVDDNSNDYDGSAYTFYVHSASANRSLYYYSDSNNPSPSNPTAVTTTSSYSSGNRSNVKFGGPCDNTITCIAPNITVSAVDQTSATVIWAPGNTENSWNLEYKPVGNTLWTSITGITSNTYTLTGLTPSTRYDVRMQSDCGGDVSSWKTADFMTECGEITNLPYMENFDSYATGENGEYPSCWGKINTYSSNRPYVNTTHYGTSGASLYFYAGTSGTYNIAVTPPFDANIDITNLQAVFMYRATNGSDRLIVGVMSDPANASTFVPVDTVEPASTVSTWIEKTVYFNNYTGTGQYIAFKNEYTTTGCYAYIDNLEIGNIPTCPKPLSLTATAVTSNSITLGWTDLSSASSWNIEYGQGTFNPGSGVGTLELANSNPYTITGLAANTSYTFYVQADCGGGDLSYFSSAYTVSTACAAIDSIPFVENFDSHTGATSTSVSVNNLPSCWSFLNTGTNTSYTGYPIIYSSSTYAHSGTNVLRFYSGTGTYGSQMAILPPIDENYYPMNTLQVSFYARALNTTYPFKLVVGVLANPASMSSFTAIDTLNITSTAHTLYEIPLGHYSGPGTYIGLLAPQPVTGMNYGYVDNIMVGLMPSCPKPTGLTASNITTTSIDLSWNENGSASNWVVEYGLTGFTQGTGTTVQVQGTPGTTITGLNTSTTYDFYVQADCGGGDVSAFSSVCSASTACDAITTLPFTENFDTYGTGESAYPNCWFKINTYSANRPYVNSTHYAGTASLYFFTGSASTYNIAVTPEFDASINISNLQAVFMYRANSSTDRLIVGVMTNPMDANTFVPVETISPASTASQWVEKTVYFNNYTGTGHYIAFKNAYTSTSSYAYIDNLEIGNVPTCLKPTNVTTSNPTTTSINLSWTENNTASNWVVEYGPSGFTQGTGSTVQVQGTPSTTITGLSASTTYDFYVKSVCGAGDESYWSNAATGSTLCDAVTQLPYTENFDSYGTGTAAYPHCWSKINTYTSGDRPYCNSSYAYGGSTAGLYFYSSSSTYNIAITPEFDASIPINTLKASFKFRGNSSSYATVLVVGVMSNPSNASTFVPVDTVLPGATVSAWVDREVSFANYTGTGHYIAFKSGDYGATTAYYAGMDNLVISLDSTQIGACAIPTGVTASNLQQTSATITWTAGGSETAWELQYKTASGSWSNSINVTGTPSHNLTGLTAGTQYQVHVRAVCSATETSNWSGVATFTTPSVPVTPPTVTTLAADNISSSAATLHGTVTDGSETITARGFQWKATTGGTYATVNATGNTMSFNLTDLAPNTGYTFKAFATTASGTTFGSEMTFTTQNPQQDTCPSPTNVTVTSVTATTAVVAWTQPDNTATSWDLLYKLSAADSWYTVTTSNNPYTLAGLSGESSYDVRVIAHCTNGIPSDPSATITFMTVGIDDYTLDNTVSLYPNPTNGKVYVESSDNMENVEVYDAYGKLLGTETVNSNVANVDLTGYAKGTYFVRVTTEKDIVTKRVVKN